MLVQQAGHLEHIDRFFAAEHLRELVVGNDKTSVFRVLQLMAFDIMPQFFHDLRTR